MGNVQYSLSSLTKKAPTAESMCRLFENMREDISHYEQLSARMYRANRNIALVEPLGELADVTSSLTQLWLDTVHVTRRSAAQLDEVSAACASELDGNSYCDTVDGLGVPRDLGTLQREMAEQAVRMQHSLQDAMMLQSNLDTFKREELGTLFLNNIYLGIYIFIY